MVLALGVLWSLVLAWQVIGRIGGKPVARVLSLASVAIAIGGTVVPWIFLFYLW